MLKTHQGQTWLNHLGIISLLLAGMVWMAIPAAQITAQDGNRLRVGQPVGGEITNDVYRQLYTFSGREDQVISLSMTATGGDLDPFLLLMTDSGVVVAASDDDGKDKDAAISAVRLTANGEYFVIATRFGHAQGLTTGGYELLLQTIGNSNLTGEALPIGEQAFGQLNNQDAAHIYSFSGTRGQVINIQMRRTSGSLDPMLDLFDADGLPLRTGDDDPTNPESLDAGIINYMLPADGTYYVRATRYGREGGNTTGSYVLTLTEVPVERLGTRPSNARLIEYGQTLDATITQETWTRFFRFEAQRGDVISAIVQRETGNLAPRVSLLAADLMAISVSPDTAAITEARIPGASIPETGTYYIAVSRYRGADGTSEGAFSLELNGREGIGGTDALELIYGAQVSGIINDETLSEEYLFVGEAGDRITVTMVRLEGDLDPLLTLRDAEGKQLTFDDDGVEGTKDAIIRYTLPADGIYIIEASRFEKEDGQTSGVYGLTLERGN